MTLLLLSLRSENSELRRTGSVFYAIAQINTIFDRFNGNFRGYFTKNDLIGWCKLKSDPNTAIEWMGRAGLFF